MSIQSDGIACACRLSNTPVGDVWFPPTGKPMRIPVGHGNARDLTDSEMDRLTRWLSGHQPDERDQAHP